MNALNILIVDDEKNITDKLCYSLAKRNFNACGAYSSRQALKVLAENDIDLVITDVILPEINGLELLMQIKSKFPEIEVIMISGHGNMDMVIQAIHAGAVDFIRKPFNTLDIQLAIKRTKKYLELQNYLSIVQNKNSLISIELEDNIEKKFIGASKDIRDIINLALKVSNDRDINIMITGENGTGKEIVARIIHHASERKNKPFFPVNSAAIPETLLESEFFGHRKGAFTDARENRRGYFELANGGSLFLDEIGDMPFSLQAKLLRAIEEKRIKQVGSDKEFEVDIRIISATNQNIEKLIEDKKFRIDLYHRINSFMIHITPLRERSEDIEPLLLHFIKMFAKKKNKMIPKINRNIIKELKKYHFPGNVRELKNITERALVLCTNDTLNLSDFTVSLERKKSKIFSYTNLNLEKNEIRLIYEALSKSGYNQNRASKYLGISRDSLIRRMKKYDIQIKKEIPSNK